MTLKGRKERMKEGRNEEDTKEGKRRQEGRKPGKENGRSPSVNLWETSNSRLRKL